MGAAIIFNDNEQTVILDRSYEKIIQGVNHAKKNRTFFEYVHSDKKFALNPDHIRCIREKR